MSGASDPHTGSDGCVAARPSPWFQVGTDGAGGTAGVSSGEGAGPGSVCVSDPVVRFLSFGRRLFAGCCMDPTVLHTHVLVSSSSRQRGTRPVLSETQPQTLERRRAPERLPAAPARRPLPGLGSATAAARPPRCPKHHGLSKKVPGILKVASVSLPGACAKGKSKSFFSTQTQDPLSELPLERRRVEDRPSLPPQGPGVSVP